MLFEQDFESYQKPILQGETSAVAQTRSLLENLPSLDAAVHAYLYVDAEGALAQAAQVDAKRARGERLGSLAGVPIAIKDNLCMRGVPTTCASKILEGYVPPYDAHVIERLRAADAVLIGKTNMDEFAMGSSNENSAYGAVHNPWNLDHCPGGSSGGSAAVVAAGLALGSLGSDTGGSVRQPGAFCGVTAIKPTYGRVSRYGLIAFASSLDQVGPFARSVRDAAVLLEAISGLDVRDATSVTKEVPNYGAVLDQPVSGLRVGLVKGCLGQGTDPEMADAMQAAIKVLSAQGCDIVEIDLPHAEHAVAAYYLIAPAEASSNLARFDGMRYGLRVTGEDLADTYAKSRAQGFGREVQRRIMLGTYALSAGYYDAYYMRAAKVRTLICRDYADAFKRCDVVLTPTAPTPAFKLGEKTSDPLAMYLADIFTLPPSLAGLPALNVPCGFSRGGLPLGMQLTGPAFEEARILRLASAYERSTNWLSRKPNPTEKA